MDAIPIFVTLTLDAKRILFLVMITIPAPLMVVIPLLDVIIMMLFVMMIINVPMIIVTLPLVVYIQPLNVL
jgi:hypothetical protein